MRAAAWSISPSSFGWKPLTIVAAESAAAATNSSAAPTCHGIPASLSNARGRAMAGPLAAARGSVTTVVKVTAMASADGLREEALAAVRRYADAALERVPFVPGETPVPVGGRVIGTPEVEALVEASLDGWLTEGRFATGFAQSFAAAVGRSHVSLVGSGSQANLLATAAALSRVHERPLRPGDEVITAAVGFPTTIGPAYQQGLVPVYVDVEPDTYNPSLDAIAAAIGPRTRGLILAHTLGNPF